MLTTEEWILLDSNVRKLHESPVFLFKANSLINDTVDEIRRLVNHNGAKIVFLDNLHLFYSEDGFGRKREEELGMILRSLKHLAIELNIPIVVSCGLRHMKRSYTYSLSKEDLLCKHCADVFADAIILLYRPEYYRIFSEDTGKNKYCKSELIIDENKNGELGRIRIGYDPLCLHFLEVDKETGKPTPSVPPTQTREEQEEMMKKLKEGNPVIEDLIDGLGLDFSSPS